MHVGIILDGNRRWAKRRAMPAVFGHKKGVDNFEDIANYAAASGEIDTLSAYALSTENLRRSQTELNALFEIFLSFEKKVPSYREQGIRVRFSGNLALLPQKLCDSFARIIEQTAEGSNLVLNLCIAHGGRDEIVRAAARIAEAKEAFSEAGFEKFLDTAGLPPVDLVIRTGGAHRLSNFLLWQCAYAELYFTETLWPAFSRAEFDSALEFYQKQQRNFGR